MTEVRGEFLLEGLLAMIPGILRTVTFFLLVPSVRANLKFAGGIAVALEFSRVPLPPTDILLQSALAIVSAIGSAIPALLFSEYLSLTAKSVDLLRGGLWAEQMVHEERQSPFEAFAQLSFVTYLFSSEKRYVFLAEVHPQAVPTSRGIIADLDAIFWKSVDFAFPFLVAVMTIEFVQGLVQRVSRRGSLELSSVKLLLALLFLYEEWAL